MAVRLLLLVVAILIPSISGDCTVERALPLFRRAVYNFNADLTNRIAENTENHFVSSSISLWTLLSAVAEGAQHSTLAELQYVLKHHYYRCFTLSYYDIVKNITTRDEDSTLERCGVAVADESLEIMDGYKNNIAKIGISEVQSISFNNFDYAANIVNDYVRRATHNTISDLLSPSDFEEKYLFLIDAIYFKGKWRSPFKVEETEVSPFYDEKGKQIGDVNMMFQIGNFKYSIIPLLNATVIELPYGEKDRHSMLIVLPLPDGTLNRVIDDLKTFSLRSILDLLKNAREQNIYLNLPRFKITSDLDLKDLLMDMGLTKMFDELDASFPLISSFTLYVSDVIQKASIEVTEEGTTAAAVSEAAFAGRSMPDQVTVNRPFYFMIVDKVNQLILFNGAYTKPSIY